MPVEYPEHPFWKFSLKIYGGEGVSRACINIQDRHEMDVNLLLLGTWFGASGRGRLSKSQLDAAIGVSRQWNREIVCNLRSIRERLKDGFEGFSANHTDGMRKAVLALEIECEQIEHFALAGALGAAADGPDDDGTDGAAFSLSSLWINPTLAQRSFTCATSARRSRDSLRLMAALIGDKTYVFTMRLAAGVADANADMNLSAAIAAPVNIDTSTSAAFETSIVSLGGLYERYTSSTTLDGPAAARETLRKRRPAAFRSASRRGAYPLQSSAPPRK